MRRFLAVCDTIDRQNLLGRDVKPLHPCCATMLLFTVSSRRQWMKRIERVPPLHGFEREIRIKSLLGPLLSLVYKRQYRHSLPLAGSLRWIFKSRRPLKTTRKLPMDGLYPWQCSKTRSKLWQTTFEIEPLLAGFADPRLSQQIVQPMFGLA